MKSSIFRYKTGIIFVFLSVVSFQLNAQDKTTENADEENIGRFISFQATLLQPVAFGDNFANDALSQKVGYHVAMRFYVYKKFFLGAEGGSFSADVENKALVGDFDDSNANTYGITAGYSFLFNETNALDAAASYGFANYRNKKNNVDDRFVDNGNYVKLQVQYNYKFSQSLSVYAMAAWRYDFLDIDASPQIDDFINQAQYLTFGIGVKFNVITDRSKLW